MELGLEGKTAIVTGGSRGIGLRVAQYFSQAGASVMLVARSAPALKEGANAILAEGGKAAWCSADVTDAEDVRRCVEKTVEAFGSVDVLVNNAGINPLQGPLVEIDVNLAARAGDVNLMAPLLWSREVWQAGMQETGGTILNISAISAMGIYRNAGWYGAVKAGLLHLTRQLAYEMAPLVRVNAIAPGMVETTMGEANAKEFGMVVRDDRSARPSRAQMAGSVPLRRLGSTDDIAAAALFLCSDAASWITGSTLVVDGGLLTLPHGST